jgi:hypothetical protein
VGDYEDLVSAIGASAASTYVPLVSKYGLTGTLVKRCRLEFAKRSDNYLVGTDQCEREIAVLSDLIPCLGKSKDTYLAKRANLSTALVRSIRLQQGILTFDYSGQVPDSVLGTSTDMELAERYGVPACVVSSARKLRGIAKPDSAKSDSLRKLAQGGQVDKELAEEIHSLSIEIPAADIAKKLGITKSLVRRAQLVSGALSKPRFEYLVQSMPELVARLGHETDLQLAAEHGVTEYLVTGLRNHLSIARFTPHDKLAREMPLLVQRLGSASDTELAGEFGLTVMRVYELRTSLGIPKFSPQLKLATDNPDLVTKLGTVSDTQLASDVGLPLHTVRGLRQHLGVKRHVSPVDYSDVDPSILEMLRTRSLAEVSRVTKLDTQKLRRIRNAWNIPAFEVKSAFTQEIVDSLGSASDYDLARRFGIERSHLTKRRIELGIKPFANSGAQATPITNDAIEFLGKIPDRDIAERYGISAGKVKAERVLRGIPVCPSSRSYASLPADLISQLGKRKDIALANEFGLPRVTINRARRSLGIPAFAR